MTKEEMILNELNNLKKIKNNFLNIIKIKFLSFSFKKKTLLAKIPIEKKLLNPFGYLHGGITTALAETVGCSLSYINFKEKYKKNIDKYDIFSIEISINYIKHVQCGFLFAESNLYHNGKIINFVKVRIFNEQNIYIGFCKMTNLIINKK